MCVSILSIYTHTHTHIHIHRCLKWILLQLISQTYNLLFSFVQMISTFLIKLLEIIPIFLGVWQGQRSYWHILYMFLRAINLVLQNSNHNPREGMCMCMHTHNTHVHKTNRNKRLCKLQTQNKIKKLKAWLLYRKKWQYHSKVIENC